MQSFNQWPIIVVALFASSPLTAQGAAQHPLDAPYNFFDRNPALDAPPVGGGGP